MIDKIKIVKLVEEKLDDKMFLVDISVTTNNVIQVFVDSFNGLTIEQCIDISRNVEHNMDREEEDFALQVSSPGLNESFKVKEQYYKYTGREVEIISSSEVKFEGLLKEANDEGIVMETSSLEKVKGQKKKQLIIREHKFDYNEIKSAKAVISFK